MSILENKVLLNILIPTYNRPFSALRAVASCIEIVDKRVRVYINSNGYQGELEVLKNKSDQVIYTSFLENKGANENFKYLLKKADAHFSLILSDEDIIDIKLLPKLLNWLEDNIDISIGFCNIINETDFTNYFKSKQETVSINYIRFINPYIHTYLSGYIFNNKLLENINLDNIFESNISNVYPHVVLSYHLLKNTQGAFFRDNIIIKGKENNIGGDSHSHIKMAQDLAFLNPKIYGSYGRGMQFYYLQNTFKKIDKPRFINFYNVMYDLNLLIDFVHAIDISNNITGLQDDYLVKLDEAYIDSSKSSLEMKSSIWPDLRNFYVKSIARTILKIMILIKKIYIKIYNLCLKN
jgi:hypothetical protein